MIGHVQAYTANGAQHPLLWPFLISLLGHVALFGVILFRPQWQTQSDWRPSVIDVQMVDLSQVSSGTAPKSESGGEKAPVVEKTEAVKSQAEKVKAEAAAEVQTEAKPEVSIARPEPKAKTALKYKTFKPKNVLKQAIDRLERKVEASPPKPLQDTIKRLREQVAKEDRPPTAEEGTGAGGEGAEIGGPSGPGRARAIQLVDIYMRDVAFQIQKNWAFSEQLAGSSKNLVATLAFRVMPDGTIEDIAFFDRSGNAYLDDSAYKAIVKSSPVKPFPPGLSQPYLQMGINFGPKGIQQ